MYEVSFQSGRGVDTETRVLLTAETERELLPMLMRVIRISRGTQLSVQWFADVNVIPDPAQAHPFGGDE